MRSTRLARRATSCRATAAVAALAGALALTVAPAGAAQASTQCGLRTTTIALALFGDPHSYFPIDGGTFESADLSPFDVVGAPSVVQENEPWQVLGSTDTRSLALPPGAALRATFCVGLGEDSMRLFTKSPGLPGGSLTIRTTVATGYGSSATTSTTIRREEAGWSLSPRLPLPSLLTLDGRRYVTVSFKNTGSGSWQLDDLLVDPWRTL
jgi:hypothetical protein